MAEKQQLNFKELYIELVIIADHLRCTLVQIVYLVNLNILTTLLPLAHLSRQWRLPPVVLLDCRRETGGGKARLHGVYLVPRFTTSIEVQLVVWVAVLAVAEAEIVRKGFPFCIRVCL